MKNNNAIEFPCYFKTKEGLLCHTVTERCFEKKFIIGLPKYFPVNDFVEGCRVIEGKPYLRMPTHSDSIERIRNLYPNYLKFVRKFGEEMCLFSMDKISRIYSPKAVAKEIYLSKYNANDSIIFDAKRLIEIVIECFGVDINSIGIEGSIMLGGYRSNSDIDVVIYGENESQKIVDSFTNIACYPEVHLYDMSDIDLIFSRRYKYRSFKTNVELLSQEKKRTTGLINKRRFWLQPVLGELFCENPDDCMVKINIVDDVFEVVDDTFSKFWPSHYKILNKDNQVINLDCYDPIYMNQAKKGDKVLLRGSLYLNTFNNQKCIILGPWIATEQYLRIV